MSLRAERSELAARVAEDLAQHQYTQLVNENGVEVWRCQQPGTRVYHFDICVTAYGMSMFGDIDVLQAATLVAVMVAVMSQLLSDVGYVLLNPRVRFA